MCQIECFDISTECKQKTKVFEIELFDNLTVCKQKADV